jgi:ABC-2 type transport system ATP-binding protein
VVADDALANLTNRPRDPETTLLEIDADGGAPNPSDVQQRLEQVSGVSRVVMKDSKGGRLSFEVESLQGRHVHSDLSRSVVNAGWSLREVRALNLTLEEIFLRLTGSERKEIARRDNEGDTK